MKIKLPKTFLIKNKIALGDFFFRNWLGKGALKLSFLFTISAATSRASIQFDREIYISSSCGFLVRALWWRLLLLRLLDLNSSGFRLFMSEPSLIRD